jgi:hypothetical protein
MFPRETCSAVEPGNCSSFTRNNANASSILPARAARKAAVFSEISPKS